MLYQFRDWESYRYDLWRLPEVGYLRGPDPRPLPPGGYVSYFGTAHTFGRFCNHPYPDQLRRRHGFPGIDLSTSSVGPRYFLLKPALLEIANAGRACVIQAPSARSCGNSRFHNRNTGNNVFQEVGAPDDSPRIHEGQIFNPLFAQGRVDEAAQLAIEMKATWVEEMKTLLNAVTTPKVLLWLSSRTPAYTPGRKSWQAMCGEFPQLVDEQMIEEVRPLADAYVQVVSREGLPIQFPNRFAGGPGRCFFGKLYRDSHGYYPSDEMQTLAADALAPVLAPYFSEAERAAVKADPGPHARMIDLAEEAARTPGERDPFAAVMMLQALNGFHLQSAVEGRVAAVGKLEPYLGSLVEALASGAKDDGPVRLAVVGGLGAEARPELDAILAQLPEQGVVVIQNGGAATGARAELVKRLRRTHRLGIAAFVDSAAVLTPNRNARALAAWLAAALREATVPQFRARTRRLADKDYPFFKSRARSDFDIDHVAFAETQPPLLVR